VYQLLNQILELIIFAGLSYLGRAYFHTSYFHTSYLYILKHFETFPHICVKIRNPVWLSLLSHQVHKAGNWNHPATWEQCMILAVALVVALAVAFVHSAV
jgi:hypothetical protein